MGSTVIVMTVDQRGSRSGADLVEALLERLAAPDRARAWRLPFERTAGDEVQGVVAGAGAAVELALELASTGSWSVGVGIGPVREPLPASTRAAAGAAFENAREAVARAKRTAEGVAVRGQEDVPASDVEALLQLLVALMARRSPAGREVCDLLRAGMSQAQAADRLGISKQAVSQRLRAALWAHEIRVRAVARHLLAAAAR